MGVTKITIPADGESKNILVVGRAVYVEAVGSYSSPEQVPQIFADTTNSEGFPLYPPPTRKTFGQKFSRLVIVGTAESAGDTVYIRATDDCIGTEISPLSSEQRRARAGVSFTVTTTDSAQSLEEIQIVDEDGFLPSKIYISCRSNDVAYAFKASPIQGSGLGSILTAGGDPVPVEGIEFITGLRFISAVSNSAAELTVHLEY